jgi:hypothetical protein
MPWYGWVILVGIVILGLVLSDIFGQPWVVVCPHCGRRITHEHVDADEDGGGRIEK